MPKAQSKEDNPEKLEIQGAQDEENQNQITKQYAMNTTVRKQTQMR